GRGKVKTHSWTDSFYQFNEMIANLIKDHGFSWSDFDDMSEEDLHDIVNSKAELKKKKRSVKEKESNPSSSIEDFLKQNELIYYIRWMKHLDLFCLLLFFCLIFTYIKY